jgi:hypothetical protein
MAGVFSFLGGLFQGRPQAIAPPTEQVQAILDRIHDEAQPCLHLVPGAEGRTRLGGEADVSGDWPRFRDRPMACLARIDLQEVHAAGGPDWLPAEGRLHVFLDMGDRRPSSLAPASSAWRRALPDLSRRRMTCDREAGSPPSP